MLRGFSFRSTKVNTEWNGNNRCRIDSRIDEPKWGFELLREGSHLEKHCNRFVENGRYWTWIKKGNCKIGFSSILLLDFVTRHTVGLPPLPSRLHHTWLISVWKHRRRNSGGMVFFLPGNYSSAQISDASNRIVEDFLSYDFTLSWELLLDRSQGYDPLELFLEHQRVLCDYIPANISLMLENWYVKAKYEPGSFLLQYVHDAPCCSYLK